MLRWKSIRFLIAALFVATVTVGFAGCDTTEEAGDEVEDMGDEMSQIQQSEPAQIV